MACSDVMPSHRSIWDNRLRGSIKAGMGRAGVAGLACQGDPFIPKQRFEK